MAGREPEVFPLAGSEKTWSDPEVPERGPDQDPRLQFEAVSQFDNEEKRVVRALIDGTTLKHQAKRLFQAQQEAVTPPEVAKAKKPTRERARA